MNFCKAALGGLIYSCVFFAGLASGQGSSGKLDPYDSTPAGEHYHQVVKLYAEKRFDEALRESDDEIRLAPKNSAAYRRHSAVLGALQRYQEGLADAETAVKLARTPAGRSRAAYTKGERLLNLNRKAEAFNAFIQAAAIDPTYPRAHYGKGQVYFSGHNFRRAAQELTVAVALEPSNAPSWALLAECQYALGQAEKGMQFAQKAVALDPKNATGYRARAIGFEQSKNYEAMLADATRSLQADPTMGFVHLIRGRAFQRLGRYKEALDEYALEPNRAEAEPFIDSVHQVLRGPLGTGSFVTRPGCKADKFPTPFTHTLFEDDCGEIRPPVPIQTAPAEPDRPKPGVAGVPQRHK